MESLGFTRALKGKSHGVKAAVWAGVNRIEVRDVPEPEIQEDRDIIVKVSSAAICGSDLHLRDGYVLGMKDGDIMGHEFMGEVVDKGNAVDTIVVGDRVLVPFPIACGTCFFCRQGLTTLCETSNPNARYEDMLWGNSGAGMYGYSHLTGGYPGGQAEYVRVRMADANAFVVDPDMSDEQVLFLTDILPTGYMGAELCDIKPEDTIAVWGSGPVGLMAMLSAKFLGARNIIAIDRFEYRLNMARDHIGALALNYDDVDVRSTLKDMTNGRGPDAVIDAVGMEAHSSWLPQEVYDKAKQWLRLQTDRGAALRQAILAVRNGGVVSVIGAYSGYLDKFPIGAVMNRSLTLRSGQAHVHKYLKPLYEQIKAGAIDPSFIITHTLPLEQAPEAYKMFKLKQDNCVKVVLKP